MKHRIAVMFLRVLTRMVGWFSIKVFGETAFSGVPDDGVRQYDFEQDSSFAQLMEADWFLEALREISRNEAEMEAAVVLKYVEAGNLDQARCAHAAMTVFEDIETIFEKYAKQYQAGRKS